MKRRSGVDDGGLGGAVRGLRRAAGRRAGPRRPARPAAGLLHGPAAAGRAQERRADGGQGRPGPGRRRAPVLAPLRRQGRLGRRAPCSRRCATTRSPRCWSVARSGPGWSTTPGCRRRAGSRSAWRASTAASSASGRIVRSRSRSRSRPGTPACRSPAGSTCPRPGPTDPARRALAGVPEEVGFATKPEIALDQIRQALAGGVPPGVVVTDAGYGNDTDFRDGVTALGLAYVAGIQGTTGLWPPGAGPLPAAPWGGSGRPPKRLRRDPEHQPLAAEKLAAGLPAGAWRTVTWREGTAGPLASRFAAVRVRPAHDDFRAERAARGGVVPRRVARGREGAGPLLALHPARGRHAGGAGRDREAALAHRARLRGAEAGAGPRPLRGARLARLPPPRQPVHRRVRLPGGRALPLFPSGLAAPARRPRAAGRLPPPQLPPCAPSGTARPRSRPCAGTSRSR